MKITATELKYRLGKYLDVAAERGPVIIEKSGRKKAVIISYPLYTSEKRVEMAVDYNPAGGYTLKERPVGEATWSGVIETGLKANSDATDFYRRVAGRLALHATQGTVVESYKDYNELGG